jgi:hypothetical protein
LLVIMCLVLPVGTLCVCAEFDAEGLKPERQRADRWRYRGASRATHRVIYPPTPALTAPWLSPFQVKFPLQLAETPLQRGALHRVRAPDSSGAPHTDEFDADEPYMR